MEWLQSFKTKHFLLLGGIIFLSLFFYATSVFAPLEKELNFLVRRLGFVSSFESPFLYAALHGFVFIPVFLLSFDKKVAFYKTWKYLLPAIFIVGILFIAWDSYFTRLGVWGFNATYLTGLSFVDLPLEELFFFFTVPYACVFIYECLKAYFPKSHVRFKEKRISLVLGCAILMIGLINFSTIYTGLTCTYLGITLIGVYLSGYGEISRFYFTYIIVLIPFVLVNGLLTGCFTQEPVVLYNNSETLGIRIGSIPVEDFFYNMLYLLNVIVLLEYFRFKDVSKR